MKKIMYIINQNDTLKQIQNERFVELLTNYSKTKSKEIVYIDTKHCNTTNVLKRKNFDLAHLHAVNMSKKECVEISKSGVHTYPMKFESFINKTDGKLKGVYADTCNSFFSNAKAIHLLFSKHMFEHTSILMVTFAYRNDLQIQKPAKLAPKSSYTKWKKYLPEHENDNSTIKRTNHMIVDYADQFGYYVERVMNDDDLVANYRKGVYCLQYIVKKK